MSAPYSPGRLQQAQADRIDAHDRQRSSRVGRLDQRLDVFELAEEIGILQDDGGGLVGEGGRERSLDRSCPPRRGDRDQLGLEVREERRQDLAVLGMDRTRRRRRGRTAG